MHVAVASVAGNSPIRGIVPNLPVSQVLKKLAEYLLFSLFVERTLFERLDLLAVKIVFSLLLRVSQ